MYQLISDLPENSLPSVLRLFDRISIPFDPANTDYQAYLRWLEEGNEPLPPDEPVGISTT